MKIAIIGCGVMGKALAKILSLEHNVFLYDHRLEKRQSLEKLGYGKACTDLTEALKDVDCVILAIKPQSLNALTEVFPHDLCPPILISLLAGISIDHLKKHFTACHLIRMMPNLAMTYGKGLIGLSTPETLPQTTKDLINQLCQPLGMVYWLPESKLNAFTSLASSGPGFVFVLIEAMIDAGIAMGFNAQDSQAIVQQMLVGSLHVLEQSKKHPGELKWQVASPGGTTIAGLRKLEEEGIRGKLINTFLAALERAQNLG